METIILDDKILPTLFLLFSSLYLLGYSVIFRNWNPKHRAEASSCFISLAHGTPAVFMATHAITTQTHLPFPELLASANTNFQNLVLDFSIAYFLTDLLHYIICLPHDFLFILHHVATLYVFITCRFVVHYGAFSILALLILAEVTSPCQNVWSLAGFQKAQVPASAKLYEVLSPPFYAMYSMVRGIMGPLFVHQMWVFYKSKSAENLMERWAWVSWIVVTTTGILLSVLWVMNNWIDWYRDRSYRALKKVK